MKRIIVFCGTGIATSQTVAGRVATALEDRGIYDVMTDAIDVKSIEAEAKSATLCVSITPEAQYNISIPMFDGIKFLTGMGMDEELDKIIAALK